MSSDNTDKVNDITMDSFELIIRNLKILTNIKPNDKLIKHGDTIKIDAPYLYQGLSRYWNGDSRKSSLEHIENLIEESFTMIDLIYGDEIERRTGGMNNYYNQSSQQYFETENSQKLSIFSTELQNVLKGLNHLKQTYHSDISICSRIDVVIEKINLRIKKIQELFQINVNSNINASINMQNNTIHVEDLHDNLQFSDTGSDSD